MASETDRGLFVSALVAAGYRVLAANPLSTSRWYRERHSTSGATSDQRDVKALAELARTDGHAHRPVAGDSDLAEAVKVLARAHQSLCGPGSGRPTGCGPRCGEFYPGALAAFDDLVAPDAVAVWGIEPTPSLGRTLSVSKIGAA